MQLINKFVHLRTKSSYSMLESTLTVDKLIKCSKNVGMKAICLSDRGNLFGSLEFALEAIKAGIQPIHGSLLKIKFLDEVSLVNKLDKALEYQFAEILLIAKDDIGYANLLKLVSYTFIKNDRKICEHITFDDLIKYQEGIIVLSCYTEGIVGKLLLKNDIKEATLQAKRLQKIFEDRFYFEIMRHNLENENLIEENYLNIAVELGIPLVATNNVLFKDIKSHYEHDVLLCISAGVTKEYQERIKVSNQCYFKSPQEMIDLFSDLPEAIINSYYISQRCSVMAEARAPMLPNFATDGTSEVQLLLSQAKNGLEDRLSNILKYKKLDSIEIDNFKEQYYIRLNYELDIICKMNFAGYFLIVSDFIIWSKKNNITVGPGRGSGAGSIVAWCLYITDLDPLEFGLLFERFLNPERITFPDFDIDFCQERREEVINYVRGKYGTDRVGHIITFGKLQAKAVIKDVARVLSLPYKFAEVLTGLVPFNAVNPVTLLDAIKEVAELKSASQGLGLYELKGENELIEQVLKVAIELEGLHRHASIHAAGIVISGKNLIEVVPVYNDINSNMLTVQYSMKYAELAGLMKFDFLGLQTLTVITKCIELLKNQGIDINFEIFGYEDKKTYELLSKGSGTGVFQFESIGMKDTLRRLKPTSIHDIIALGALYRPGPMENIPTYIACKNGLQEPNYLHPILKPILEETHGVIIYQEQVMEIAKTLAGYSLGAADLLRRAMGKKIKSEMAAQEENFIQGAKTNGVIEDQAKSIFAAVSKFASYGFPKAHASAYGIISYQTAFLKANYTIEFLVTCLNLEINNNDKINLFIQEARNNLIPIISPNINTSYANFTIYKNQTKDGKIIKSITYALGAIKNVTKNFGDELVEERNKNGEFKNIFNFIERISTKIINKKLLENLIKAGCFDSIEKNYNKLLLNIPSFINYSNSFHQARLSDQMSLINISPKTTKEILIEPDTAVIDNTFDEFEVLGLFLNKHPLNSYLENLESLNIYNSYKLQNSLSPGSSIIKIAGIIQKKEARMSNRGRFITLQLSDPFGIFDLTVFSEEVLKEYGNLLNIKSEVIATCELWSDEGGYRLTAKSFAPVSDVLKNNKHALKLYLKSYKQTCEIIDLLNNCVNINDSNSEITIILPHINGFSAKINLSKPFYLTRRDIESLKTLVENNLYETVS